MRAAGDKQLFGGGTKRQQRTPGKVRHLLNSIICVSLFSVFCHVPVVRVSTEELVLMHGPRLGEFSCQCGIKGTVLPFIDHLCNVGKYIYI